MAEGPGSGTIKTTALIVAAGSGQRLGAGGPKALVELAGRPMYEWSLRALLAANLVGEVIIAIPPGRAGHFAEAEATLVDGGQARSQSVAAGLALVGTEFVLVHDAARPLVTPDLIDRSIATLDSSPEVDAVIAAAPVTDTIKSVDADGIVSDTLDRAGLRSVQTPQVFRTEALREAMSSGDLESATDDAFLIESAGGKVKILDAPASNMKVTVAADLATAELLLAQSSG